MLFAARPLPDGNWGRWEPLESRADIRQEHHFATCFEIDPVELEVVQNRSVPKRGVCHRYKGPFCMDFDDGEPEKSRQRVIQVMSILQSQYGLDPNIPSIRYFFSGSKGYHVEVPQEFFGALGFISGLGLVYRDFCHGAGIADYLDMRIYNTGQGRMWRLPNRMRPNGKHKIPLTFDEISNETAEAHAEWARLPRELSYINGISQQGIPGLVEMFQKTLEQQKTHTQTGISIADIAENAPKGFKLSDCIEKILSKDPSVNERSVFHHVSFVVSLYFKILSIEWKEAKELARFWIENTTSKTYSTPEHRWVHFESNFFQVQAADYKFSCHAARGIVRQPRCQTCPICLQPDYAQMLSTNGVRAARGCYIMGVYNKREDTWDDLPVSSGVIVPTVVAASTPENPNNSFEANIAFPDGTEAGPIPLDFSLLKNADTTIAAVQKQCGVGGRVFSLFPPNARVFQGIRLLIGGQMLNLPQYLPAGLTQGLYQFNDKWYWVDSGGCRTNDWKSSANVRLDKKEQLFENGVPRQTLTEYQPCMDVDVIRSFFESAYAIQEPHVTAGLLGFAVASFFRQRFKHLAKTALIPNVDSFPLLIHTGSAGSGKTTFDQYVLSLLFGYVGATDLQVPNFTYAYAAKLLMQANNSTPLLLDEFKSNLLNANQNCIQVHQVNLFARSIWDGAMIGRGKDDHGSVSWAIPGTLKLAGPELVHGLDEATMHRMVHIHTTFSNAMKRKARFEDYVRVFSGTTVPQTIGARLAREAIEMADDDLLTLLKDCIALAERGTQSGVSTRKVAGLAKILFGHRIIDRLIQNHWMMKTTCLLEETVEQLVKPGEVSAERTASLPDWQKLIRNIFDLTSTSTQVAQLIPLRDYWFDTTESGEWFFAVNLAAVWEKRAAMHRACPGLMDTVAMSLEDFIDIIRREGMLIPKINGIYCSDREQVPGSGDRRRGRFVFFNVEALKKRDLSVDGIIGTERM